MLKGLLSKECSHILSLISLSTFRETNKKQKCTSKALITSPFHCDFLLDTNLNDLIQSECQ